MKDKPASKDIQGDANKKASGAPKPPDNKTRQNTQQISGENAETQITKFESEIRSEIKSAEKWMIWLTGAVAFFGLCTVAVGILQWRVMSGQLGEMMSGGTDTHNLASAAKNQADAMVASERPWLSADLAAENNLIWVNGEQAALTVRLSIKNLGKSIAKDVLVNIKMLPASSEMPIALNARDEQQSLCNKPAADMVKFDLFPSDKPAEQVVSISVIPAAIAPIAAAYRDGKSRRFVGLYIIGCIRYHSSFATQAHQTRFARHLLGPPVMSRDGKFLTLPDGKAPLAGFEIGVEVPKKKLGLMNEILAYNDAN